MSKKINLLAQLEHAPLNAQCQPAEAYNYILSQTGCFKFAAEVADALTAKLKASAPPKPH